MPSPVHAIRVQLGCVLAQLRSVQRRRTQQECKMRRPQRRRGMRLRRVTRPEAGRVAPAKAARDETHTEEADDTTRHVARRARRTQMR
jgi:hypothetical protein